MVDEIKDKLYSTSELAEKAGVSAAYIRRLLAVGDLQGVKVARNWLIPRQEAERWIRERQSEN
jgi:excisionase family DNA binding protein